MASHTDDNPHADDDPGAPTSAAPASGDPAPASAASGGSSPAAAAPGSARPAPRRRSFPWRAWFQASRPTFFVATLVPILLGHAAAVAWRGVAPAGLFAMILAACFLVQLAANMADDLFEHLQGVDDGPAIGGSRVIQEGKITVRQLAAAVSLCLLAALALAFPIARKSVWLWAMAVCGGLSSVLYVCPPVKYGHRGLGEVAVFLNMGLIMTFGANLALTGVPDPKVAALALPAALMVAGVLFFQSLPEIETDAAVGKRTLAVILGKRRAPLLHLLLWPVAWLLMANLWLSSLAAWPALLGVVVLPVHLLVLGRIRRAAATGGWLELDRSGPLVRLMYLINGLTLVAAVHLGG